MAHVRYDYKDELELPSSPDAAPAGVATAPVTSPVGSFYWRVLGDLLSRGLVSTGMKTLVVCGGPYDRAAMESRGFQDVTLSNLDVRLKGDEFAPYKWSFQDAENLGFDDNSFDFVVVHNGLHHCHSPHRALLEMYRVARRAALVFEPRDTVLTRAGTKLGITNDFEVSAVVDNNHTFGGVGNTDVPNFIYRWTEHEVWKTLRTYAPQVRHEIEFFHGVRMPYDRLASGKSRRALMMARALEPLVRAVAALAPRLGNEFGFYINKCEEAGRLQDWLEMVDGRVRINRRWTSERFR